MRHDKIRNGLLAAMLAGSLFFTSACDPTVQTTVENGAVSASQSLFGAYLRAILELNAEQQQQQDPNQTQSG
jgi:hypothetical protein